MKTIGFRVEPDRVHFAIVEEQDGDFIVVVCDSIRLAQALDFPLQLRNLRTATMTLLGQHIIDGAFIRASEPIRKPHKGRVHIEGVLTEVIGSIGIPRFATGPIATFESRLKLGKGAFKPLRDAATIEFDDGWGERSQIERECILAAVAIMPSQAQL